MDLENKGYLRKLISIARFRIPLMLSKWLFGAPTIKHHCSLSYPRQSLRQHLLDSNTRYRDSPHFQDPPRLKKGYTSRFCSNMTIVTLESHNSVLWNGIVTVKYDPQMTHKTKIMIQGSMLYFLIYYSSSFNMLVIENSSRDWDGKY